MYENKIDVMKLRNDLVFKAVYGSDTEESKCALMGLLNKILDREDDPIVEVTHKNPFQMSQHIDDKETILDIKVETDSGELIDIEMQLKAGEDIIDRFIFYHGGLIRESLKKGETYDKMKPTITICIADAVLFRDNEEFLSKFYFMEQHRHFKLSDDTCIYFIELPKVNFERREIEKLSNLEVNLEFLKHADENESEYVDKLVQRGGKELQMAQKILKKATEDEILRERAIAREKWEWDMLSRLKHGYDKGYEQGLAAGELDANRRSAARMKARGHSIEEILAIFDLPIEEIEKL